MAFGKDKNDSAVKRPSEPAVYVVCPDCGESFFAVNSYGHPLTRPDQVSKTITMNKIKKFDGDFLVLWPCANRGSAASTACEIKAETHKRLYGHILGSAHYNVFMVPEGLDEVHDRVSARSYFNQRTGGGSSSIVKPLDEDGGLLDSIPMQDHERAKQYTDEPGF